MFSIDKKLTGDAGTDTTAGEDGDGVLERSGFTLDVSSRDGLILGTATLGS